MKPRHSASLLVSLLVLAACADHGGGPLTPAPLPPLSEAAWHVHSANGQPLPALVAHGLVQNRLEQTFLDSARLDIRANGRWEQHSFLQTWRDGQRVGSAARLDHGTWVANDSGYVFTSELHTHRFVIRNPSSDSLALAFAVPEVPGLTTVTVRRAPAPPLPTGDWRASQVRGRPIPDAIYVFDPTTLNGRTVSIHLVVDSAQLVLEPTGRYTHRIFVTEWEGEPGGPPHTPRFRFFHGDFGQWQRTGELLRFESAWLQNHRVQGSFGADGVLRMSHGFTHGDEPVEFRYDR